ncbi:hypothetical protein FACS1894179_05580 [Bacteroidia bacterium]|nr:hypothetical protein FACS1894179_05580 [Bacteroidia bacterium]
MKKSLFKLILGVFATVMLFSSCLGDGNSSFENQTFAYITTKDGVQCAAMDGNYFTSPLIKTLTPGRCYILGYRTNWEAVSGNILLAEDIAQPIALTTTYGRVSSPTVENTFNPSAFQPEIAVYSDYLGNNCSFIYIAKLKEKDTPRAHCFYDVNRQYEMIDGVRQDVGKNQIIIDVRFDYISGADGSSVNASWRSVSDLSEIKRWYKQNSENYDPSVSGDFVKVDVKFRYNQLQSNETVKEDVYIGSWTSSPCYFEYEKGQ